jgi:hypothetical protein
VLRFIIRVIRYAFIGSFFAALVAKLTLKSNADPETQEIDLVSIFEGRELVSAADPFYGGKILTMFAGTVLDLRAVTAAPTGVYIDVMMLFGGLSLVVPIGWKVVFAGEVVGGGFDNATHENTDPDAPVLRITGRIILSGVQATPRSPLEAVA